MSARHRAKVEAARFADRLRAARRRAGLTQEDLGGLADLAPITLSKLETGVNRPTFEIFLALAHALGASPNYLGGWDDADSPKEPAAEKRLLVNRLILACDGLSVDWIEQLVAIAEKAGRR